MASNKYSLVLGFECACHLFRTHSYKVVSLSDYATRIRTYDQSSGAVCFDQQVGRETKSRNGNKVELYSRWTSNDEERLLEMEL